MASKLQFTGEAFYNIHAARLLSTHNCGVDDWQDLAAEDRDAWQAVADAALESQGAAVNDAFNCIMLGRVVKT